MKHEVMQETKVYRTKDLDAFTILPFNREVEAKRVGMLRESIKKHGFILPIIVDQNMNVLDGQHRLYVASELECSVLYIIFEVEKEELLPIIISQLNACSKNWPLDQYLRCFAERNVEPYVYLQSEIDSFGLTFTEAYKIVLTSGIGMALLTGSDKGKGWQKIDTKFKLGGWDLNDEEKIIMSEKMTLFKRLIMFSPRFNDFRPAFRSACLRVALHALYDEERMFSMLEKNAGFLLGAKSQLDYWVQLNDVYNHNHRKLKLRKVNLLRRPTKKEIKEYAREQEKAA